MEGIAKAEVDGFFDADVVEVSADGVERDAIHLDDGGARCASAQGFDGKRSRSTEWIEIRSARQKRHECIEDGLAKAGEGRARDFASFGGDQLVTGVFSRDDLHQRLLFVEFCKRVFDLFDSLFDDLCIGGVSEAQTSGCLEGFARDGGDFGFHE